MADKPLVQSGEDLIADYWQGKKKEKKKVLNPTEAFKKFCESEPSALECREYDI